MYYIKRKYFRLFILIIFGLLFLNNLKVIKTDAKEIPTKKYVPPRHGIKRKISRVPGGSRSNECKIQNEPIILLIPEDHVATTVSSYPEIHWYLKDSTYPIRFTLIEPGQIDPIYVANLDIKQPGLVKLKLPESASPLKLDKLYKWTVSIICNPQNPSENIFAKGWIKKVKQPIFDPEASCLQNYGEAGIWYNALLCQPSSSSEYHKLLGEVGLPNFVSSSAEDRDKKN